MRRIAAVIAAASLLAVGACSSLPNGVDGDLVDNWAAMPTPTVTLPVVGDCYQSVSADMQGNDPVSCTQSHQVQVVKVGTFTGADASKSTKPASGSSAIRDAYGVCESAAKTYLGGDFHSGLLQLTVVTADGVAWSGGARWFRCDVNKVVALSDLESDPATGSFQGILSRSGPLKLICITWTDHKTYLDDYRPASCTKPHAGEYVGTYDAPSAYPSPSKKFNSLADSGCEGVVAKFLGIPGGRDTNYSVGWAWSYTPKAAWESGDHYIRCYAASFTHDGKFVGSVKGIGRKTARG